MNPGTRRSLGAAALLLAACIASPAVAQDVKGKLVLYTSQPERDASQTVAAFKRVQPGVEVEVFRSGTTEVMGKLAAEFAAGAPKADVLLIADAASMEALKKDGRLLAYPEAKVAGLAVDAARPAAQARRVMVTAKIAPALFNYTGDGDTFNTHFQGGSPGITDAKVELQQDEPQIQITENLAAAQRYGLKPGDVRRAAGVLVAGEEVGDIYTAGKTYDVQVWSTPQTRSKVLAMVLVRPWICRTRPSVSCRSFQ